MPDDVECGILRARGFEIVDDEGLTRIEAGAWRQGAFSIRFLDRDGKLQLNLGSGIDGQPNIGIFESGFPRFQVSYLNDGKLHIMALPESASRHGFEIEITEQGEGQVKMRLFDKTGKPRLVFGVSGDKPFVEAVGADGIPIVQSLKERFGID